MFLSRKKKNNVYLCKPQFYNIKVGFKGGQYYIGYFSLQAIRCCVLIRNCSKVIKLFFFLSVANIFLLHTVRCCVLIIHCSKDYYISYCAESTLSLRKHAYSNILRILPPKNENCQTKNSGSFHISAQNIGCGYSLEPPHWGGSNEYPQSMFLSRNKKK